MFSSRAVSSVMRARPAAAPSTSRLVAGARARALHASPRTMRPLPKEEQSGHTVSQRLRSGLKAIPVEIYPLVVVISCGLVFGVYSFIRPALQDKTLRLHRQRGHD
ncbi:uncharacterized protein K452DRAFT_300671 [Aplosporella prunicola CBS 121167]|uniref:Uncharacterized protein n=1 Tax=Aplosporella prunicola CBS 121167 TaxID=1176127 RepID=A0A6A6B4Z6_9PEZI|nr:uncharacterized protein K452DRAFT_300671 [Aplosporella prunicola CBS 121167]KAF2139110.1 hypothetical protein K452DRAFT_300671 [Aplosporella prunicola CBS 121167]